MRALVMVLLYFGGIVVGVLAALLLKSTVFQGEAVPFVMELPNYRLPGLKNVAQLLWEKATRLPAEGLYGHLCGHHRHLVPAEL